MAFSEFETAAVLKTKYRKQKKTNKAVKNFAGIESVSTADHVEFSMYFCCSLFVHVTADPVKFFFVAVAYLCMLQLFRCRFVHVAVAYNILPCSILYKVVPVQILSMLWSLTIVHAQFVHAATTVLACRLAND